MERVDFAQYFMSLGTRNENEKKKLSHVIGKDHKLMQLSENKTHILILKLMKV